MSLIYPGVSYGAYCAGRNLCIYIRGPGAPANMTPDQRSTFYIALAIVAVLAAIWYYRTFWKGVANSPNTGMRARMSLASPSRQPSRWRRKMCSY
jgi:hypothetical protein